MRSTSTWDRPDSTRSLKNDHPRTLSAAPSQEGPFSVNNNADPNGTAHTGPQRQAVACLCGPISHIATAILISLDKFSGFAIGVTNSPHQGSVPDNTVWTDHRSRGRHLNEEDGKAPV